MATSVYGSVPAGDLQPGEHLVDGQSLAIALQPQAARSGLTALVGGGALGATPLLPGLNEIDTVATAADSCLLPLALAGATVTIYCAAASNAPTIWPQASNPNNSGAAADVIRNLADTVVTSLSCTAGTVQSFRCFKAGVWKATI
jgi:hypothetical protein